MRWLLVVTVNIMMLSSLAGSISSAWSAGDVALLTRDVGFAGVITVMDLHLIQLWLASRGRKDRLEDNDAD